MRTTVAYSLTAHHRLWGWYRHRRLLSIGRIMEIGDERMEGFS